MKLIDNKFTYTQMLINERKVIEKKTMRLRLRLRLSDGVFQNVTA